MFSAVERAPLAHIDRSFRPTLRNVDHPNPKLMVLFSGAQGSGKTTVAKAIEEGFSGLRIESDAVHALATELLPDASPFDRWNVSRTYIEAVRDRLAQTARNGMMILDCSIDRHADTIFKFAERYNYPSFVIAMNTPYAVNRERVIGREARAFDTTSTQLDSLGAGREDQERFLTTYQPDLTISPEQDTHEALSAIGSRLATLALRQVS